MTNATTNQLALIYKGHQIEIHTGSANGRWAWVAVIDHKRTVGGRVESQTSAQLAIDEGRATVERLLDAEETH